MEITRELIAEIPKTDLHLHLDGSIRIETLIELARQEKVELPSFTVEGLCETVFKDNYESLEDYLAHGGYQALRKVITGLSPILSSFQYVLRSVAGWSGAHDICESTSTTLSTMSLISGFICSMAGSVAGRSR